MPTSVKGGTGATSAAWLKERAERQERERERLEKAARKLDGEEQRTKFDGMTVAELRVYAQEYDIENYGKLKKAELCEAVRIEYERRM